MRQRREADTVRRIDLVEVTLESNDADEVQRCPAPLENHVTGTAAALGPEDDVFHDYVGHDPFIVVEEVVDLPYARRARTLLARLAT